MKSHSDAARMRRTCIIVLTWNAAWVALRCLDTLLPVLRKGYASLVVCDNGSEDDTIGQIRTWANHHFDVTPPPDRGASVADFVVIANGANLGYAAGNNVGIRFALELGAFDAVWLLNQDTRVEEDALDWLRTCAVAHPNAGILGSTLVDEHEPQRIQCAAGNRYFPLLTVLSPNHRGALLQEAHDLRRPRLDYISGAAMYIRMSALRECGLLNEDFFLFYEELDLAKRLARFGWQLEWCRRSHVFHGGGISTGARKRAQTPAALNSAYHENLSTLIYTARHHRQLLPYAAAFRFVAKLGFGLVRLNLRAWRPLWCAYRDFFLHGMTGRPHTAASPRIILHGRLPTSHHH